MGKNQWVVPLDDGNWGVRGEGNSKLTSIQNTQKEAANVARYIAKNQHSELFIQGKNHKIRERNSYGNDPYPPSG